MKMYYGPKTLIVNSKPLNKPKEKVMEKLQMFKAPPIILAATTKIEKAVADWYAKHSGKKLKTQTQQEPLQFFQAPPCIGGTKEEE